MRDLAACYSDHAVKVSDSSCSGSGSAAFGADPSTRSAVTTSLYKTKLATGKVLLIRVTWTKSLLGQGLSVGVEEHATGSAHPQTRKKAAAGASSLLLRRKKGSQSWLCGSSEVALHWDVSSAKYASGPEPVEGFYLVVMVDSELVFVLGDRNKEQGTRPEARPVPVVEGASTMVISRREQVMVGSSSQYSTKARFGEGGRDHEILIRCRAEGGPKESELSVYMDRKRVALVRRLKWNFRGNQTIFVDGIPVDLLWDVHDWWFGGASGRAAFMFRTRSAPETRLWLEEETLQGDQGFSLLIHAFRAPS